MDYCLFSSTPDEFPVEADVRLSAEALRTLHENSLGQSDAKLVVFSAALSVLLRRYQGGGPVSIDLLPAGGEQFAAEERDALPIVVDFDRGDTLRDVLAEVHHLVSHACESVQEPVVGHSARPDVLVALGRRQATDDHHDLVVRLLDDGGDVLRVIAPNGKVPSWFCRNVGTQLNSLLALFADPSRPLSCVEEVVGQYADATALGFNATERNFSTDVTVLDLFREQVRIRPEATAVISSSRTLSFAELHREAIGTARRLRESGVSRGDVVAVLAERDHCAVTAVLGIMEAGAVYLPLHPQWPAAKKERVLKEAQARLLLVHERHTDAQRALGGVAFMVLSPEAHARVSDTAEQLPAEFGDSIIGGPTPDETAYVVFTSGTTGVPKGVALKHRGLTNTTLDHIDRFAMTPKDRYLQFMALSFDGFLLDLFSTLCAGAALAIADEETIRDPERFVAWAEAHGATVSTITPSYLRLLTPAWLSQLRVLVSAGEAITPELAQRLAQHTALYNGYGPTEATVNSTLHRVDPGSRATCVPIGGPSANKQIYVLDEWQKQQPVGVCGEICISGEGIATGYINDPELTRQKFVANPFPGGPRLYRTGDFGAWTPDGSLLFRGRADNQVKVNGYRIDLRELEHALLDHPAVEQGLAMTTASDHGSTEIAVVFQSAEADESEVLQHLQSRIAEYMLPHRVVRTADWALTPHGKTDVAALRGLLLRVAPAAPARETGFTSETGAVAQAIATVWREVLKIEEVGFDESFLSLGGDSLRAIEAVHAAQKAGLMFTVKDVLRERTVRRLASHLTRNAAPSPQPPEQTTPEGAKISAEEGQVLPAEVRDDSEQRPSPVVSPPLSPSS
jgi:amino acid adenylation domain-containing protein